MYTVEEIRNAAFGRSMRGYDTDEVDDFIDRCADTVAELERQNAEQTKKLEMLAERLMEYRKEEDNIHTALLSAQRAGDALLREAKHKAELMLQDASIKAENTRESAEREIRQEKDELQRIRDEVARFKNELLEIYRQHLTVIRALPEEEAAETESPAPAAETETAENSEEPKAASDAAPTAPAVPVTVAPAADAPAAPETAEAPLVDIFSSSSAEAEETEAPEQGVLFRAEESAPHASRFSNLEFGPGYEIDKGGKRFGLGKRK